MKPKPLASLNHLTVPVLRSDMKNSSNKWKPWPGMSRSELVAGSKRGRTMSGWRIGPRFTVTRQTVRAAYLVPGRNSSEDRCLSEIFEAQTSSGSVFGRRIEIQRAQRLLAVVANLVPLALFDQQQRARFQRLRLAFHDRCALARHHEQPLVGLLMLVLWIAFGVAGRNGHHGCFRAGVAERDLETLIEIQLLALHRRSPWLGTRGINVSARNPRHADVQRPKCGCFNCSTNTSTTRGSMNTVNSTP